AVWLGDIAAKLLDIVIAKADNVEGERAKFFAHGFFVKDAQHSVFAVDAGHDGDAKIDGAIVVAHAEAAVLGDAALGDVELAHHLDAGDDSRVVLFGDGLRHGM